MAKLGIFLCAVVFALQGQSQQFNVLTIPDSLKTNADVVARYDEHVIEIKSPGKATEHERLVYTILNENGDKYGKYKTYYNKFVSIDNVSAILYNAFGKEVKHYKEKDMQDRSGEDDESLITDTRYKVNDFYCKEYPYTVEYTEEDKMDGLLELDDWIPQGNYHLSVQYSKYVIIAPKDYVVRYQAFNCSIQPVVTEMDSKKIYTWEMKNRPAVAREPLAPAWNKVLPFVLVAPSDFEAEGYQGNMSSWNDYGKFFYALYKGRDVLPEDIKKKVHELTDPVSDPKEKIAVLYHFLQTNTRYISIQLGIGGMQPFEASFVATKRYGDCKALSNYMVSLLKEAGIKANPVIIKAGENADIFDPNFCSDQFDHVICCVPMGKDTVWLECTSQTLPPGYLSGFTADRYGLLVDENGGVLVHTPKYGMKDNREVRNIHAQVNRDGTLLANVHTVYKGLQQDDLEEEINYWSKEKLLQNKKREMDLPTYDLSNLEYRQEKNLLPPSIDESFELSASNYVQVSGKRLFINPNVLNRSDLRLSLDSARRCDIELNSEFVHIDSAEILIPDGYQPESIPQDVRLESKFGKFSMAVKVFPNKILYYRYHEEVSGRFAAAEYPALVSYYDQLYKADHHRVVLVKKE